LHGRRSANRNGVALYADHLVRLPKVEVESVSEMRGRPVPSDIVWYPNQPDGTFDIRKARLLGRRVVVTFLDFIAYDIRSYHASDSRWRSYRRRQRLVALGVDGVSAISADVARRVKEEIPLIDPRRVATTALGVDHLTKQEHGSVSTYDSDIGPLVRRLCGRPFVLVLGNDFPHKNRDFAAKVWSDVVGSGYEGDLVLAGLKVDLGHASGAAVSLPVVPGHSNRIEVLDHVRPRSREWLLSNADAVLYPSSAEGFGLVPYEAAAMGTPTVFTNFGPLAEVGRDPGGPQDWSLGPYVADLRSILTDPRAASRRVAHLRSAWDSYPWSSYADRLVSFFAEVQAMPPMDGPDWMYNSLTLDGSASVRARLKRKVRDVQRLLGRRRNG
jgi:glycosyltransferase involved in cell wall biosynthesis